jgi:hypothetical protein
MCVSVRLASFYVFIIDIFCLLCLYLRIVVFYSLRLVLVFCHITVSRSVFDWLVLTGEGGFLAASVGS